MSTIKRTNGLLPESGDDIKLRVAGEQDAEALLHIYAPYVRETAITFEYEVPSPGEFAERIRTTLARYPYLVAERAGELIPVAQDRKSAPGIGVSCPMKRTGDAGTRT